MTDKNKQNEDELMMGHEYDGIQELDNPLPRWWLYGFYLCIVFSFLYVGYYHLGPGTSLVEAYNTRVDAIKAARAEKQAAAGGGATELLTKVLADGGAKEKGHTFYAERCAACHGDQGQGLIGPNLTDKFWIHGGKPDQIYATIQKGVGDKGMPAWADSMKDEEMAQTVAYIVSIKGTNPPNPKEPQGDPVEE